MKKFIRFLLLTVLLLLSLPISSKSSYASSVLFQDDFNNGNYNKWEVVMNDCIYNGQLANWKVVNKSNDDNDKKIGMISNGGPCFSELIPTDAAWDFSNKNYVVEFDMELVQGSDYAFLFRYQNNSQLNGLHIQVPDDVVLQRTEDNNDQSPIAYADFSNGQTIHFKIEIKNKTIKLYKNNQVDPIINYTYKIDPSSEGRIGLHIASGSQNSEVYFDNIIVKSIDDVKDSLNVPLIKQNNSLWKDLLYDSANVWSPKDTGIGSWGCALTSAAMVFQYHNITKMPDNKALTPDTLNTWLKKEPDGYVNGGWVNWIALSRLSKKAKANNPNFTWDALEYKRFSGENKTQLTNDLMNNIPDILEEPGHFIVAKGVENETFSINDPFYSRTSLAEYNNSFLNLGRYSPSHTDLSYFVFSSDKDTTISLKDLAGNTVGESFIQNPFVNANKPSQKNGDPFTLLLADKPQNGSYKIVITGAKNHLYSFTTFVYDINGEVITKTNSGSVGVGTETYTFQYNKNTVNNITFVKNVSYDSMIDDIKELKSGNLILPQIADSMIQIITRAKNPPGTSPKIYRLTALNSVKTLISAFQNKGIDAKAAKILTDDINILISSI